MFLTMKRIPTLCWNMSTRGRRWASIRLNVRNSRSFTSDDGVPMQTPMPMPMPPTLELVDSTQAPSDFHPESARVYENFISEEEGKAFVGDVLARMRRKRFEGGHWDAVITQYKEVEIPIPSDSEDNGATFHASSPSPESCAAIERTRRHIAEIHFNHDKDDSGIMDVHVDWLPCHAIHLRKDGSLTAHVDSVKFSGGIVAGISLLSPSIMRLKPASPGELAQANNSKEGSSIYGAGTGSADASTRSSNRNGNHSNDIGRATTSADGKSLENAGYVDLYLPPLSLYILSDVSRYRYTHELLPTSSKFGANQKVVNRDDRISIIFRDKKQCEN